MPVHQQRSHELVALAFERFAPELTTLEHTILMMSADHDLTDPHELTIEQTAIDPALAAEADQKGWQLPPERTRVDVAVRAEFVRWLISDPDVAKLADRRGMLICNAHFPKGLSLQGCVAAMPVKFIGCDFNTGADGELAELDLRDATFPALSIHSSNLGHIDATRLRVETLLEFADCASGPIEALYCHLGQLTIANVELSKMKRSNALNCTFATIAGAMTLSAVKTLHGIMFNSCSIESVSISSCELGQFSLIGCTITRWLYVDKLRKFILDKMREQSENGLRITDCDVALSASGVVSLANTNIGESLSIAALKFVGSGPIFEKGQSGRIHNLFDLTAIKVAGFCTLRSIHFGHSSALLDLKAGEFSKDLEIKDLKSSWVPQPVGSDNIVETIIHSIATSGIDLYRARISGELRCSKIELVSATVNVGSAVIEGSASFDDIECCNFLADRLKTKELRLEKTRFLNLTLRNAELGVLADDAASRSIPAGQLYAAGLCVKEFADIIEAGGGDAPPGHDRLSALAARRIDWLNLQPPEERASPRPWLSLAAMLDNLGRDREAKRVRYEMRAVYADLHPNHLTGSAIRNFARIRRNPFIVLWWTLALWALATGIFWWHRADFIPVGNSNAFVKARDPQHPETYVPRFAPPIYALENALPIVKFGQDAAWTPDPVKADTYWMLSAVRWFLIIWGWFGGAVLAFAVSQKLKD